jgi:hypothetical protein
MEAGVVGLSLVMPSTRFIRLITWLVWTPAPSWYVSVAWTPSAMLARRL